VQSAHQQLAPNTLQSMDQQTIHHTVQSIYQKPTDYSKPLVSCLQSPQDTIPLSRQTCSPDSLEFPVVDTLKDGEVYRVHCGHCHGFQGEGLSGIFPPLAQADLLHQNPFWVLGIVKQGLNGPLKVNEISYEGVMPPQSVHPVDMYRILRYIYGPLNNHADSLPGPKQIRGFWN